jgi:ribosomal-protein-alanine acetyltransferase
MTYLLRRAVLEDLPALIAHETELFGNDAWSPELMVAELSHPSSYYIVAQPDGVDQVVGYAGLRLHGRGEDADVQTIAVAGDHRGKGLGRLLLSALMDHARASEVPAIFLEVRADNDTAIGLYTSVGFDPIDRRVGYYQPDGVDAIVMRTQLHPATGGWVVGRE